MTPDLVGPIHELLAVAERLREQAARDRHVGLVPDLERIAIAARNFSALLDRLPVSANGAPVDLPLSPAARHDLLNPVNQIIGYSELLIEEGEEDGWGIPRADLEQIVRTARDLSTRVDLAAGRSPGGIDPTRRSAGASGADRPSGHLSRPLPPAAHPLLVVDDDELNRDVLAKRLERQGYQVLCAEDGVRALEILQARPVDLVLLDVMMPNMNGYQVLERMKADPALLDVPVLMISGLSEIESVVRCIEMGAADYLPKPFDPVLLNARIGACLDKKRLQDEQHRTFQALKESQETLAAELEEAAAYVRSLFPAPMQGEHVSIDWRFVPSTQLGGDAFGYQWIDDDHLALYLLDVCGHGVGAALLSVSVTNVLRSGRLQEIRASAAGTETITIDMRDPGAVLHALNESFQMELHNGQYFTMWYGVYHKRTRRLVYASGGHPPAALLTSRDGLQEPLRLGQPGLIIGGMPGVNYPVDETLIPPGARLYIFSDGLYEIPIIGGAMLNYEAFVLMLPAVQDGDRPVLDRLVAGLRRCLDDATFDDDVSIVEVRFS